MEGIEVTHRRHSEKGRKHNKQETLATKAGQHKTRENMPSIRQIGKTLKKLKADSQNQ